MATAFLRLLRCLIKEAVLVGIFTGVLGNADTFEGTENGVWAKFLGQVVLVLGQLGSIVVKLALGGGELIAGVSYKFRFRAVCVGFGKDTVFDEGDTKGAKLLIHPRAERCGEIFFKLVDCMMVSLVG